MGLFKKKKKENKKLTPDMAGYRPEREWWPDLSAYQKAILLHGITCDEVDALLKEYEKIYTGKEQLVCDFYYTSLPDDISWVYLKFPDFKNISHYLNLWNYQNLLIWFSQKTDKEFCFAIPQSQNQPLFLSTVDRENPNGDSCVGIYADRDFYLEVPGDMFEWGPVPASAFPYTDFLMERFGFDTKWISDITQCELKMTQITLDVSE